MSIVNAGEEIVPTPVGVNRVLDAPSVPRLNCPHARGGEPFEQRIFRPHAALSPRPWG